MFISSQFLQCNVATSLYCERSFTQPRSHQGNKCRLPVGMVVAAMNGINLPLGQPTSKAIRCELGAEWLGSNHGKCSTQVLQRDMPVISTISPRLLMCCVHISPPWAGGGGTQERTLFVEAKIQLSEKYLQIDTLRYSENTKIECL